jgi:hypothetical protein
MEMMVAVALLAVIMVALLTMFYETQRAFRGGANQVDVLEGGRAALQLIGRELQEIYPTATSNVVDFLAIIPDGKGPPLVQSLPGGEQRTNWLQDLTFVTRYNDEWTVTTYRVADADLGAGVLFRWSYRTNLSALPPVEGFATAVWQPDSATDSRVMDGVVHFRLLAYDADGRLIPPQRVLFMPPPPPLRVSGIGLAFPTNCLVGPVDGLPALPASVELELGILEPQALGAFRARTNIPSFNAHQFLGDRAGRVHLFKQRIPIRVSQAAQFSLSGQ